MTLKKTKKCKGGFPSKNKFMMTIEYAPCFKISSWYSKKEGFIDEFASNLHILKNNHNSLLSIYVKIMLGR